MKMLIVLSLFLTGCSCMNTTNASRFKAFEDVEYCTKQGLMSKIVYRDQLTGEVLTVMCVVSETKYN